MKINHFFPLFRLGLIGGIILSAGCQFFQPDYVEMLSPEQLREAMQSRDILLIDVHTPEQRHIKGTDLFIPYNKIAGASNQLPADKNTPIYLYCEGGPMGNAAARTLHELGYARLYNLAGGTQAWQKAGYEFQ